MNFERRYAMVKPITVNTKAMTVDGKSASGIGSFSQQELSKMMSSGIIDVTANKIIPIWLK